MSQNQKIVREVEAVLNTCENITEGVVGIVAPQDEAVVACIKRITGVVEQEINLLLLGPTGTADLHGSYNLGITGATGTTGMENICVNGTVDIPCCKTS